MIIASKTFLLFSQHPAVVISSKPMEIAANRLLSKREKIT